MYHQFKELADVDITAEPMEVGPTCHYVMGGVEVDPDTTAAMVAGLFAAGECAGGMHGSNRLGGNSLSDLLVFGKRAGAGAASYVNDLGAKRPQVAQDDVDAAARRALAPFEGDGAATENPYTVHAELQQTMNDLVGIIRTQGEVEQALRKLGELRKRAHNVIVEGHRQFNPGWHLALDLRNMILVSECVARAALRRTESRGGHTRDDHPNMEPLWRNQLLVCRVDQTEDGEAVDVQPQPQVPMPRDLLELFELGELEKYYTGDELAEHPGKQG
jgi:succinate dehydrogenase / fumarate reductase flavoprotein subunit